MEIAIVDIVFLGIIAVFAIRCAIKGVVSELLSMAALIFGLLASIFFFRKAALLIRLHFMPDIRALPEIISFIVIFLVIFAVIKLLEILLKDIIEGIKLNGPDRFLGFIFGLAEGVLVVCLLLFLLHIQPFIHPGYILRESFFAQLLIPFIMGNRREVLDSVVNLLIVQGRLCGYV